MDMTKELTKPTFIIGLDTELIWGHVAYPSYKADGDNVAIHGRVIF